MKQHFGLHVSRHPLSSAIALAMLSFSLMGTNSAYGNDHENDDTAQEEQPEQDMGKISVVGSYTTELLDTGTGLGLSLQETPQSVSIMTAQRIEDQGLQDLTDIVRNIQGISAKNRDTERSAFAARGFDIEDIQIDGVPIPAAFNAESSASAAPYERVEVVRGATGLLTGAGDPGASINLVRKHADSDVFTGNVSAGIGRWNYRSTALDLSAPLNEEASVRGRFIADYHENESFRDVYEEETSTVYGVVDADISEDTQLSFGVSHQENHPKGSTWGGLPVWYGDGSFAEWPRSKTTGAEWTGIESYHTNYFATLSHSFADDWKIDVKANRFDQRSDWTVIWWWGPIDKTTGAGREASPRIYDGFNVVDSLDIRVSGLYELFGREHELMFGASASDTEQLWIGRRAVNDWVPLDNFITWDGTQLPYPEFGPASVEQEVSIQQTGYFTATRLNMTDELKVILGGRLSTWEVDGQAWGTPLNLTEKNVFTPYVGALYDLTDEHRVYTSYNEIFKPQPFEFDRSGNVLDPLEGKAWEAGLKSRFFDGKLQTTVALFRIEQENLAQPDPGFFVPGTDDVDAKRAAKGTESQGIELEVVGELSPGWDVHFSYTDFSAKEGAKDTATDSNPTWGVNTHQPRQLLKLFTTYDMTGDLQGLTIGGGVNWEASTFTQTTNDWTDAPEKLKQDSFYLVNLMARYEFTPQLSAQLNIDNVLDEQYYDQIGFYNQYAWGEPRNFKLKVNYKF